MHFGVTQETRRLAIGNTEGIDGKLHASDLDKSNALNNFFKCFYK